MRYDGKDDKMFNLNLRGGTDLWTPLHLAASLGHHEIVTLLIENDADLMEKTKTGKTVREVAANNLVINKILRRAEKEWYQKNLHKKNNDIDHQLKQISAGSNVINLKNMISFSNHQA
mmetsp:Transcript_6150/g.5517  ORF Transcript_6150/g.5517 Transcript_6150/m.5517 type:complete len:118 (-) Transcript_6150:139-492(-)